MITCIQTVVVGLHHPLNAPALRLAGVAVQGEAVVRATVDQAAKAQSDELTVCKEWKASVKMRKKCGIFKSQSGE